MSYHSCFARKSCWVFEVEILPCDRFTIIYFPFIVSEVSEEHFRSLWLIFALSSPYKVCHYSAFRPCTSQHRDSFENSVHNSGMASLEIFGNDETRIIANKREKYNRIYGTCQGIIHLCTCFFLLACVVSISIVFFSCFDFPRRRCEVIFSHTCGSFRLQICLH